MKAYAYSRCRMRMKASALPFVAGRVGLGGDVADVVGGEQRLEAGAARARAVIGHHAADGDAVLGVGVDHGGEKGGAAFRGFVWAEVDHRPAGGVIVGHVVVVPSPV